MSQVEMCSQVSEALDTALNGDAQSLPEALLFFNEMLVGLALQNEDIDCTGAEEAINQILAKWSSK